MPFLIESGDLQFVRVSAEARFGPGEKRNEWQPIDLALPGAGVAIDGLSGSIPVVLDLLVERAPALRVKPLRGAGEGTYPRLRFADHQPFLKGTPFILARHIRVSIRDERGAKQPIDIGRLAGNLRIDRNLIALEQLEAEVDEGRVTGQCLVDLDGDDTAVHFRGAVTGIRARERDERFDMNAAVAVLPLRRTIEGRLEIVRLGRGHLGRILDLYDPYRADVNANRARLGLKIGFPKRVRLKFHEGFASVLIELGGAAGAIRIDEIEGIPIGPVMQRFAARRSEEDTE